MEIMLFDEGYVLNDFLFMKLKFYDERVLLIIGMINEF